MKDGRSEDARALSHAQETSDAQRSRSHSCARRRICEAHTTSSYARAHPSLAICPFIFRHARAF
eukprot:6183051-Pleurochrysis_carterae.AAC.5